MTLLETGEFRDEPHPEFGWVHAPAGALLAGDRTARRRHLRRGPQDRRRCASAIPAGCTHERRLPGARGAAGRRTRTVHAEFDIRNESGRDVARGGGLRRRLSPLRCGDRHADRGRPARASRARREARRDGARAAAISKCPRRTAATRCCVSPMREDVCWYYEQGWPFLLVEASTANGAPRVERVRVATAATLRRERALRAIGRAFVLSGADHLAQSRPDPRDGAARHSGAVSRHRSAARSGRSSIRCC